VLEGAVLAYEPLWAVGSGKPATPQQAQEVHVFMRERIALLDKEIAQNVQILYGGSVTGVNAQGLFGMPDIDGGLIGRASLDAEDFIAICGAANRAAHNLQPA
jgi:triosephosphate isomerase